MHQSGVAARAQHARRLLEHPHAVRVGIRKVHGAAVIADQAIFVFCEAHGRATAGAGHSISLSAHHGLWPVRSSPAIGGGTQILLNSPPFLRGGATPRPGSTSPPTTRLSTPRAGPAEPPPQGGVLVP